MRVSPYCWSWMRLAASSSRLNASSNSWSMVFSVLCGDWCAGQRWGAVNRLRVGGQPRRVRGGRSRVFGPGSPARSAVGRASIGPKRSLGRRSPARAWVERSGPRPITLRPLLTAKEGEGLRIWATARWPSAPRGADAGRKKKRGPGQPPWWGAGRARCVALSDRRPVQCSCRARMWLVA